MKEINLTSTDLRDYAKSLGWSQLTEAVKDRLYVLSHSLSPKLQIVFPIDETAPDYDEAMRRAVEKIAELHQLSISRVVNAVQAVKDDTLRYRIISGRRDGETISLSFAASMLQGAQQMLQAGACTVLKPQTHHPRLNRTEAQQLVERTRFGHTEHGSFVLRVSCPINALDGQTVMSQGQDNAMPFVRLTTLTIKRALRTLVDAMESDTLDRLVDGLKSEQAPLLSSNLCEAITRLHDEEERNAVELSFAWAASVPLPYDDKPDEIIRIQSDYFSRIEEVGRELRALDPCREDTFIGTVESLNGAMGDDSRRAGEVIVALLLHEGESVRVRLTLSADDYEQAILAHQTESAYVQITGRLHPGRQPRALTEISHFSVLMRND
jgi:hypothetical protein